MKIKLISDKHARLYARTFVQAIQTVINCLKMKDLKIEITIIEEKPRPPVKQVITYYDDLEITPTTKDIIKKMTEVK